MASANKTFLILKFIAEMFDGQTAKFSGFFIFPFMPTLITEKIVEGSLPAFRFKILGNIPNNPEAILDSDKQIYSGAFRQQFHCRQRCLRNAGWINKSDNESRSCFVETNWFLERL